MQYSTSDTEVIDALFRAFRQGQLEGVHCYEDVALNLLELAHEYIDTDESPSSEPEPESEAKKEIILPLQTDDGFTIHQCCLPPEYINLVNEVVSKMRLHWTKHGKHLVSVESVAKCNRGTSVAVIIYTAPLQQYGDYYDSFPFWANLRERYHDSCLPLVEGDCDGAIDFDNQEHSEEGYSFAIYPYCVDFDYEDKRLFRI